MERNVTCKTNPVQRAGGQSAVAAAAYRAAERLHDERREATVDFSGRRRDVRETLILAPKDAPDWVHDRQALWNRAEAAERRKDGRPARDVILGFAWELPPERQCEAAIEWANREFVEKGHVVDLAFHRYGQSVTDRTDEGRETIRRWAGHDLPFLEAQEAEGREAPHVLVDRYPSGVVRGYKVYQPHAHALVTPRALEGDGFAAKRNRILDRHETAKEWRYDWPAVQNRYLEAEGIDVRVLATTRNGDAHLPLREEGLSLDVAQMERRGVETQAKQNAEFNKAHNDAIREAAEELAPEETDSLSGDARSERDAELSVELEDPLASAHREAVNQASGLRPGASADAGRARLERIAGWWQNMRSAFSEWRHDLSDHMRDYWGRLSGTAEPEPPREPPEREPDR
ncbi:MAG: MobA/MobL family protein [Pseudomonadota bacterium]